MYEGLPVSPFCSLFTGIYAVFKAAIIIYPPVCAYNKFAIDKNNTKTLMEIIGILEHTDM